jgi:Family of unknown function (DUF6151)
MPDGMMDTIMSHPLQCRCGTLQGVIADVSNVNHAVCYCRDCQAFAYFLGRAADVLDEKGGSDIVQILPRKLSFTRGSEALACMRLTPKGLLRWYASCCNTPIGNTLATPKVSFIGLLHSCLHSGDKSLDEAFGPVRAWVNTKGARGEPKPKVVGMGVAVRWFLGTTLQARLNGDYRRTPLFQPDTGKPVVTPRVLTEAEHANVMSAVHAN